MENQFYRFYMVLKAANSTKNCKVLVDRALMALFKSEAEVSDIMSQYTTQHFSPGVFLTELIKILESKWLPQKNLPKTPKFYSKLLEELTEIGWDNIVTDVNSTLDPENLQVSLRDSNKRGHVIEVHIPPSYPDQPPTCKSMTPSPLEIQWNPTSSRLSHIISQYTIFFEQFQDFWKNLEDIDQNTCILDPINPTRADTKRRIAIKQHASVLIVISPEYPFSIPECRFLGSPSLIGPIRENMTKNIHLWNPNELTRKNLEVILQLQFPAPIQKDTLEIDMDCGICYSATSEEEQLPDMFCNGKNCNKPFHTSCLSKWLSSIRTNRKVYDTVYGECPYCCSEIVVKLFN
eukprot:TRINITY_DN18395_c0_g1_i1.p1 TRINITY_DN18395_c0_g1~~TRINITY_DN18395_c0_g1_i1.p1  ORF type:complete len:348 (-),score=93.36 TRINITY_DN18395_c0_g1_i1:36-1079(-)